MGDEAIKETDILVRVLQEIRSKRIRVIEIMKKKKKKRNKQGKLLKVKAETQL